MAKNGILVSEKHGVNPSIMTLQCSICGNVYDDGIALMGKLKGDKEAPRKVHMGLGKCKDCSEKNETFTAFIGIDPDLSKEALEGMVDGKPNPTKLHRTGSICWVKREAVSNITNGEIDGTKNDACFVAEGVIEALGRIKEGLDE